MRCSRKVLQFILVSMLLLSYGCSKRDDTDIELPTDSSTESDSTINDFETSFPVNTKYTIDGSFSDWSINQLLIEEVGVVDNDYFDLKQLYLDNDHDYLYLFIKCNPGLETYFKETRGGILAYLYIDSDMDPKTGALKKDTSGTEKMIGTETCIWIPLGTNRVSYYVSHCDLSTRNYEPSAFLGFVATSKDNPDLISYTDEGVELAINLKQLKLKPPQQVDLVCVEFGMGFDEIVNRIQISINE